MGGTSSLICDVRHHLHSGLTKRGGAILGRVQILVSWCPLPNIVQYALSPLPFPCIPTTVFATLSAHWGLRAWRCSVEGVAVGGWFLTLWPGGALGGKQKGTRTTWCERGGSWRWTNAQCCFLGSCFQEGDGNQHKTLRALTQTMKSREQWHLHLSFF